MNEKRFDGKGNLYQNARPGYPGELMIYLTAQGIVNGTTTAADIGSGTGIFTRQLAGIAKTVYAVEPNDDMRRKAEAKYSAYPNIVSVSGNAEHTALADESVDCITAAQAFHWFDRAAFKTECRRILRPGGIIALIWNDRDEESAVIRENMALNHRFCPDFKGTASGISFDPENFRDFFEGEFKVTRFDNTLRYDEDMFVNRNLSSSYAPKEDTENYQPYIAELRKLFASFARDGMIEYPYVTRCFVGRV